MSMALAPGQPPVINSLPPVVVALALAIFAVEVVFMLGARSVIGGAEAVGWRIQAIQTFGMFTQVVEFLTDRGSWISPELRRFVTYPFIHFSFTHALFVLVFLLALGKLVGEVFGNFAVLIIFFSSAIFGALIYVGVTGDQRPLIGGFPAVYGLIGAYTFILWTNYGHAGQNQWQAFTLIGILLGIQLLFGLVFGSMNDWVAETGGFLIGFVITPVVAPGGFQRLVDRLRQR